MPVPKHEMFKFIKNIQPYKWQTDARDAAEANAYGRGGIVAPTGTGKSLVIALIASRLNVRTLVVVPTVEIREQLRKALNEYFGPNKNIVVENIDSAALRSPSDFDCLIVDECHHVAAKTYQKLNKKFWNGIYYRFFLTATFFRNNSNEQLLFEGIAGEVIYKLSYKKAVKEGYIVPVEAYYIELPKQETEAFTYAEVYKQLVTDNKIRNDIIANLLKSLKDNKTSTLCLVREINHGNTISETSGVPFTNGQDEASRDNIRQFNNGGLVAVIGTTGILSEGVDTKPCEYVVLAGLGKAKSSFMQQIGRAVRTYPGKESAKIIIFKDSSHNFTLRHFKEQKKILLEEYGVVPVRLDI